MKTSKKLDGNKIFRIKKVKKDKKEMFFPQKKGMFGWRNVYYDLYFETQDGATAFLDDYTTGEKELISYIDYNNSKAIQRFDLPSKILHILCKDL
jgi:hypothetical protein